MKRLVVHLASSPLAGAPSNLVRALNEYGCSSTAVLIQTSSHQNSKQAYFMPNCIRLFREGEVDALASELLAEASIIHLHNVLQPEALAWLAKIEPHGRLVYHVHSPADERPLFLPLAEEMGLSFTRRFAVCHFHPRAFQSYTPMPNIVLRHSTQALTQRDPVELLFSPSHLGGGRWNAKTSVAFEQALGELVGDPRLRVHRAEKLSPHEVFELRRRCQILIDELVTGSFHLVSLEGLACGNVVLGGADDLSLSAACMGFRVDELPPFVRVVPEQLFSTISSMISDGSLEDLQEASLEYFHRYLRPERLVSFYEDEYTKLLA